MHDPTRPIELPFRSAEPRSHVRVTAPPYDQDREIIPMAIDYLVARYSDLAAPPPFRQDAGHPAT